MHRDGVTRLQPLHQVLQTEEEDDGLIGGNHKPPADGAAAFLAALFPYFAFAVLCVLCVLCAPALGAASNP